MAPPSAVNLQAVQNAAAHLITVTTSRQSCGSFSGCRFGNAPSSIKLAFLMFKVLNSLVPPYLSDDCQLVSATSRRQLLSSSVETCVLQRTITRLVDRAFAAAGQRLWNSLPPELRKPDLSLSRRLGQSVGN